MTRIAISGTDRVVVGPSGSSLLAVLQEAGHPIATSCGGVATCGLCKVTVQHGKEHLSPICPEEINHLGSIAKIVGLRLACQARCSGDGEVRVEVPEVEDVAARKAAKAERLRQMRNGNPGGRR
jgi:ferredoxin